MVKLKLYGFLSLFIFSIPKLFSVTPHRSETTALNEPLTNFFTADFPTEPEKEPEVISVKKPKPIKVSASVYFPVVAQTDSTPFITADGSKISKKKPGKHRWVAVSRNLLRKWGGSIEYGDTLQIKGISKKLDGQYVVRDTMKRQLKNRIDILVGQDDNIMGFWNDVRIYHLN